MPDRSDRRRRLQLWQRAKENTAERPTPDPYAFKANPVRSTMSALTSVPEHAHCEMCQVPVKVGERRCGSAECEQKFQDAIKAKKRGMYMFIALVVGVLLLSTLMRQVA